MRKIGLPDRVVAERDENHYYSEAGGFSRVGVRMLTLTLVAALIVAVAIPTARAQTSPRPNSGAKQQPAAGGAAHADESTTVADAWKMIAEGTSDKSVRKRIPALLTLGSAGDRPEVERILVKAMEDSHADVRRAAAAALGKARIRGAIPRLQKALDDPSPRVRVAAARSLWEMKDYSGSTLFEHIAMHQALPEEKGLREEWHKAMTRVNDPSYVLVTGMQEGAGMLLGPYSFAIPVYRYLSADKAAPSRAAAATLLGELHTDPAVQALEMALVDDQPVVRAAAAIALGKSERPAEIVQLGPLLHDHRAVVRLSAASAIARLSPVGSGDKDAGK
jgi:HEAT repeat protein